MTRTPTADRVIAAARAEIGYREGRSNGHWNNDQKFSKQVPGLEWSDDQPWCATFVAWCAMKAKVSDLFPRTASCDAGGQWFKDRGRWSTYPAVGAQVFFGTPSDLSHTGIVVSYTDTEIVTIEGNTNSSGSREGDGVYRKTHLRRSSRVVGYGYPRYPEGILSADPAYSEAAPGPGGRRGRTPWKRSRAALRKVAESSPNPERRRAARAALAELERVS